MTATATSQTDRGSAAPMLLVVVCAAQFILQLDFSIVNVALSTIQRELGFSAADLQWVVTGYALTYGSLLLLGGRTADLLGRRRLFLVGLSLFALASLTCGLAQSPWMLIVSRLVQGACGAMVSPTALAILTTTYAEGPRRNQALGIWQATAAGGATAGVILGGFLTYYFDWRAIFLVNVPIVAIVVALAWRQLPADRPAGGQHLDVVGAGLASAALGALIFGLSNGQDHGFGSPETVLTLVGSVVLAAVFVWVERSSPSPMLPASIFASATRRAAYGAMLLTGSIVAAYVYFGSLYLQRVLGFDPLISGLSFVPATATVALVSTLGARRLLGRVGVKTMLLVGLGFVGVGQLWLAQIGDGGSYVLNVLPGLLLTSIGMGLVFPTAAVAATTGVQPGDQGLAGGLLNTSQQVGSAIGLAVLATLAAARTQAVSGSLAAGYALSFLVAVGIAIAAAALVLSQLNGPACEQELERRRQTDPQPHSAAPFLGPRGPR